MNFIKKLFHRHSWKNYKAIPEYGMTYTVGNIMGADGTAVFSKCACGARKKTWYQLRYKIVEGFLVHIL